MFRLLAIYTKKRCACEWNLELVGGSNPSHPPKNLLKIMKRKLNLDKFIQRVCWGSETETLGEKEDENQQTKLEIHHPQSPLSPLFSPMFFLNKKGKGD
jgi:hypothetical protein